MWSFPGAQIFTKTAGKEELLNLSTLLPDVLVLVAQLHLYMIYLYSAKTVHYSYHLP